MSWFHDQVRPDSSLWCPAFIVNVLNTFGVTLEQQQLCVRARCLSGRATFYLAFRCTNEVIIFSSYLRRTQAWREFLHLILFTLQRMLPFHLWQHLHARRGTRLAWYHRLRVIYSTRSVLGHVTASVGQELLEVLQSRNVSQRLFLYFLADNFHLPAGRLAHNLGCS